MSALIDFYYGRLDPYHTQLKRERELEWLEEKMKENQEKLMLGLGKEEKEILSAIIDAQEELLEAARKEMFIQGFQVGMGFAADALLVPPETLAKAF